MKKIVLLFCIIFLMGSISAFNFDTSTSSELGRFKQGDCISLYQNCDNCSYINLTKIQFPNGTIRIIKEAMVKDDIDYNYSFCVTSDLGNYYYTMKGDKNGIVSTERLSFEITASGQSITEGKTLGGLGILFSIFVIAFTFLFIGNKLSQNDKLMPIGFFFSVMAVIMVIFSLHMGWVLSENILQDEVLTQGISRIFFVVLWGVVGVSIIFFCLMLISFIRELGKIAKKKKFGEDFNPLTDTY